MLFKITGSIHLWAYLLIEASHQEVIEMFFGGVGSHDIHLCVQSILEMANNAVIRVNGNSDLLNFYARILSNAKIASVVPHIATKCSSTSLHCEVPPLKN